MKRVTVSVVFSFHAAVSGCAVWQQLVDTSVVIFTKFETPVSEIFIFNKLEAHMNWFSHSAAHNHGLKCVVVTPSVSSVGWDLEG